MTSEIVYQGELRTQATHVQSGQQLITDAPLDNQGKGAAFSPTDLVATALGSCMLTIMGIFQRNHDLPSIVGTRVEITKIMASEPRRIAGVQVHFYMPPHHFNTKDRQRLENAARTCPVAYSLHPDIAQDVVFHWQ
ncbi:MAG: OsmC family protein [Sphingobacteriales bacterium]|nr:OsmC family protein [Sphingobacteriales bacterium]